MNLPTRRGLTGMLAAAALLLAACGDDGATDGEASPETEELELISPGTLTVCTDAPYAPFEFEDPDAPSGYSGFDIDLMQAIADTLGLELSVLLQGFDALESGTALAADQCDIAASAMTITEQRAENLGFSDPYYDSLQSLLVSTESGLSSLGEFSGRNLGVQGATTGAVYAEENAPDGTQIIEFPGDAELWQALQAGNIDGILQDLPVNLTHAETEGYEIVEEFDTGEQYGFAVKREGKEALLEAVNEQLAGLRADGTYDEIYNEYFATD
jgi:polar amino acid transport system substrate-binding protein